MLELQMNFRHHSDMFVGTQNYANQVGNWECVVDEFVAELLAEHRSGPLPYDGVIARTSRNLDKEAKRCNLPLVNVWFNSPADSPANVFPDYESAGRLAAKHLIDRGLRRFACISAKRDRAHPVFIKGFHEALEEKGYSCSCALSSIDPVHTAVAWRKFQNTLDKWIASWKPPVGVFVAYHDITCRHVTDACRRHGMDVPGDVALVAGGNETAICLNPTPSLTGIETPYQEVGFEAARLLDQLMSGEQPPQQPVLLMSAGIVARQSTDSFAVEDDLVANALRFIANHSHEPIQVNDVAAAVHTSRRTLERKFRQLTGRAIFAEIRRFRVERAKRLLVDSDLQIKQIAHLSGFPSSARLYQVFQQLVNQSPSEFREESKSRKASR